MDPPLWSCAMSQLPRSAADFGEEPHCKYPQQPFSLYRVPCEFWLFPRLTFELKVLILCPYEKQKENRRPVFTAITTEDVLKFFLYRHTYCSEHLRAYGSKSRVNRLGRSHIFVNKFVFRRGSLPVDQVILIHEHSISHTRRTTVGRTPLDEWSARRRDRYLTTHDTQNRQTSMPPVGFEPTISAG